MSSQVLKIKGTLPGLNEYIGAMNRNRFIGNKMKQENTDLVAWQCKSLRSFAKPVRIIFTWIEPSARRDPDNFTSFGRKVILDGMVKGGLIPDDSQKWVKGWTDSWVVNKIQPEIIIVISEVEDV